LSTYLCNTDVLYLFVTFYFYLYALTIRISLSFFDDCLAITTELHFLQKPFASPFAPIVTVIKLRQSGHFIRLTCPFIRLSPSPINTQSLYLIYCHCKVGNSFAKVNYPSYSQCVDYSVFQTFAYVGT